jgi:hypothetical protein
VDAQGAAPIAGGHAQRRHHSRQGGPRRPLLRLRSRAEGIAPSRNYPHLAGQRAEYTWKVLRDYKEFRRDEGNGRHQTMVRLGQS